MTEPSAPPGRGAARPPEGSPPPPLHLQYATPKPKGQWGPDHPVLRITRQLVFAIGLAMLLFGITSALAGVYQRDAPYWAAWGAGFVGISTPLWRVRKDQD